MEAPASITCETCRQRWQRLHDDQGRAIIHTPIGYATLHVRQGDEEKYFATARSYADLRSLVRKIEPGTGFSIRLCVFLDIIGIAHYTRQADGVEVLDEDETCMGLYLAMSEAEHD